VTAEDDTGYPYPVVTQEITRDPQSGQWSCEAHYRSRRFTILFISHGDVEEPPGWHAEAHRVGGGPAFRSWRAACSGPLDGFYPTREQALFDALLLIKRWVDEEADSTHIVPLWQERA